MQLIQQPALLASMLGRRWTPARLPGCVLWLDAKKEAQRRGYAIGGSAVSLPQWSDDSGEDNHATQATAAAQPVLTDDGARVVVRSDGTDDALSLGTNNADLAINDDLSILAVVKKAGGSVFAMIVAYQAGPGGDNSYELRLSSNTSPNLNFVHAGATAETFTSTGIVSDNAFHIVGVRRSGTDIDLRIDGAWSGGGTATVAPTSTASSEGFVGRRADTTGFFPGDILGVVLGSSAWTDAEFDRTERWLNNRYQLGVL